TIRTHHLPIFRFAGDHVQDLGPEPGLALGLFLRAEASLKHKFAAAFQRQFGGLGWFVLPLSAAPTVASKSSTEQQIFAALLMWIFRAAARRNGTIGKARSN